MSVWRTLCRGQEQHPNGEIPGILKRNLPLLKDRMEERMRKRGQQAGPIVRISAGVLGPAMRQISQRQQSLLDQQMTGSAGDIGQKTGAAGIMFPTGLIERILARAGHIRRRRIHTIPSLLVKNATCTKASRPA